MCCRRVTLSIVCSVRRERERPSERPATERRRPVDACGKSASVRRFPKLGGESCGRFYRRLAYRIGKAKAITATARKLAILVYRTLKGELVYQDPGAATYDARHRESVVRRLRQRAAALGFSLVNGQTGEILEGVS